MHSEYVLSMRGIIPSICILNLKEEVCIVVDIEFSYITMWVLKNHINFKFLMLSCISGIDLGSFWYWFCVVYDLLSLLYNSWIRVKIFLKENSAVDSMSSVYNCSNW